MSTENNLNDYEKEQNNIEPLHIEDGSYENTDSANRKDSKFGKTHMGILGALVILLVKFKSAILLALPFLKGGIIFAKMGKFAGTLISMLLTVLIYMQAYGLPFAIGFVLLIFIHEMGHSLMAKYEGLDVSTPMFIPFVGAIIRMKELPKSAMMEARIAMGGPVLGSLGAFLCYGLYIATNDSFFLHLSYVGLMINLFNLIPLSPLDGGRIASAISPVLWIAGLIIAIGVMFWMFSPILLLIIILGAIEAYHTWKEPNPEYYAISRTERLTLTFLFFGLVAILGAGMAAIYHGMV